jgi:hypothetical protein
LALPDEHIEDDAESVEDFDELLDAVGTPSAQAAPPPVRYETPPHMHLAYPASSLSHSPESIAAARVFNNIQAMQARSASAMDFLVAYRPDEIAHLPRPDFERALHAQLASQATEGQPLAPANHAINSVGTQLGNPFVDPVPGPAPPQAAARVPANYAIPAPPAIREMQVGHQREVTNSSALSPRKTSRSGLSSNRSERD